MSKRATFLAALVVLSVLAPVGAALAAGPSDDLDYDGDTAAPDAFFDVDTLTVAKHPVSEGTSADAMAGYYDDSGAWVDDPMFVVNTTTDESVQSTMNKYTYDPAKVEDDDRNEFPRTDGEEGDNDASVMDSGEWNSVTGDTSTSDTTVASNVDAINLATNGSMGAGNTIEMGYANWSSSFDSDESKRVFQVAGEVNSMDSGASVNISLEDEDGDRKTVMIEPDASQSKNTSVAYGQTSGTFTYQVKLSNLPFDSGSGTWDNIESINVSVVEADADISISWLAFNKKGKTALGDKAVDTNVDSDGDYDQTNTTYNATGTINVKSISSLDSDFDDASLTDVQFPVKFPISELTGAEGEEETYVINWDSAEDYPSYDAILNASYRMEMPSQIDLSYSGMDLQLEQGYPSGRYLELGYEADVGENANLSQASLTDQTGNLGSVDDRVDIQTGASSDQWYIVHYELKLTEDEEAAVKGGSSDDAGGGGQFAEGGSGGPLSFLFSVPGMIIGGILTALGLRKASGSGG